MNDPDHSFFWTGLQEVGPAGQRAWVWKNAIRDNYVLFMDAFLAKWTTRNNPWRRPRNPAFGTHPDPYSEGIRSAIGRVRTYAGKVDLAVMTPQNTLSSTAYCLAHPGLEYLVYQPQSDAAFTVRLKAGTFDHQWLNPSTGAVSSSGAFTGGEGDQTFAAPFAGDTVLHIANEPIVVEIAAGITDRTPATATPATPVRASWISRPGA